MSMRLSARLLNACKRLTVFLLCFTFLFFSLSPFLLPSPAHAQTTNFNIPNTDPNVPNNQHYYAQSVVIETLSAIICQLAGVDLENPGTPCLSINQSTNKLG